MLFAPKVNEAADRSDTDGSAWLQLSDYRVFMLGSGAGFSAWGNYLLNTWTPDATEDGGGWSIYLKDQDSGQVWTVSGAPLTEQAGGAMRLHGACITMERNHAGIDARLDICIVEDQCPIELRQLCLTNSSSVRRHIGVTGYLELAFNEPEAHAGHPAFSKLFVQTRWDADNQTWLVQRRARGNDEHHPHLAFSLLDRQVDEWTSERPTFIGRGRDRSCPRALAGAAPLAGVAGNVLDPGLALRTALALEPGETAVLTFAMSVAAQRETLEHQIRRWRSVDAVAMLLDARRRPALDAQIPAAWLKQACGGGKGVEFASNSRSGVTLPTINRSGGAELDRLLPTEDETLSHFNGYGGFDLASHEYVIKLSVQDDGRLRLPPMPWTNVLANPGFGVVVSETGATATWAGNSREHRLTPWCNDPISDPPQEAFFIRDEDSGRFWSLLPAAANAPVNHEVRHGQGYSIWRFEFDELAIECCMFVLRTESARVMRVRLGNRSDRARRLSVYGYSRWVLGTTPERTESQIRSWFDSDLQAASAERIDDSAYPGVALVTLMGAESLSSTCAREAFLGQPGRIAAPLAVRSGGALSADAQGGPCAALRGSLTLAAGETRELSFVLAFCADWSAAASLLQALRAPGAIERELSDVCKFWKDLCARLQIRTPSPEIDLMVNAWLPYQNLACRLWGRTAFYQSGGAFGFRDQLQDAAALTLLRPDLIRQQILLHAAHQFVEGDVLHWWHPPLSKGMRTRFADDLLWMPLLCAQYATSTGDYGVLDELQPFLVGELLADGEDERYLQPVASGEAGDVYEHCCRAIDRSLVFGQHGLPLFGCGDWNDGMSRVGREGKGESVWMGFFLHTVLAHFEPMCVRRGDVLRQQRYQQARQALQVALNADGWDGAWYRRAWYDNGAPLGSAESDECKIDSLVQAWAVISGVATPERQVAALDALEQHLIDEEAHLIRLLTPPFEHTPHDPGYIKGYVAGVRENGGQYTHAALWAVKAMAMAGRRDRAARLLTMLSPIHHSNTPEKVQRYKVEPYVVAADIYGAPPHIGRGGWTWYTGSAGWMYRVAIESICGLTIEEGRVLHLNPCIPDEWPMFEVHYQTTAGAHYHIEVRNPAGRSACIRQAVLDGQIIEPTSRGISLPLASDAGQHYLLVTLGA